MKKLFLKLLPDIVQENPDRYLETKFLYYILVSTVYFLVSIYGYLEHRDSLFWLNIDDGAKVFVVYASYAFLFIGFMGFIICIGTLLNVPFQIFKELWKIYSHRHPPSV